MCKLIRKSNEQILCKLGKSEILRLYSIIHVAMEITKTSKFTSQSKFFISIYFTCQVSACELQPFSYHDLANDLYSQTAKTVFSHLNWCEFSENRFYVISRGFDFENGASIWQKWLSFCVMPTKVDPGMQYM